MQVIHADPAAFGLSNDAAAFFVDVEFRKII